MYAETYFVYSKSLQSLEFFRSYMSGIAFKRLLAAFCKIQGSKEGPEKAGNLVFIKNTGTPSSNEKVVKLDSPESLSVKLDLLFNFF